MSVSFRDLSLLFKLMSNSIYTHEAVAAIQLTACVLTNLAAGCGGQRNLGSLPAVAL